MNYTDYVIGGMSIDVYNIYLKLKSAMKKFDVSFHTIVIQDENGNGPITVVHKECLAFSEGQVWIKIVHDEYETVCKSVRIDINEIK